MSSPMLCKIPHGSFEDFPAMPVISESLENSCVTNLGKQGETPILAPLLSQTHDIDKNLTQVRG